MGGVSSQLARDPRSMCRACSAPRHRRSQQRQARPSAKAKQLQPDAIHKRERESFQEGQQVEDPIECKQKITGEKVDSAGQSAKYNYIIFVELPWHGGTNVVCIRAKAPEDREINLLTLLKLPIGHAKANFKMPPGATACLMDMVTCSNEAFSAMVHG